jgi:predicted flap endonuclease-1-like 5' DNA nuclease
MRSDYALYVVALIFFAITVISFIVLTGFQENLSAVATVVLGLLFAGLGYTQRPRAKVEAIQAPQRAPATSPSQATTEVAKAVDQQKTETKIEPKPTESELVKIELTAVKGVKEKRAEQLKALGIRSVEELASASARDLAGKLRISPKFTEQWIENAKELSKRS